MVDAPAPAPGRAARAMDSAGPHPFLLHLGRLGGGRGGAQVRADVSQGPRAPAAYESNRARDLLSWQFHRGALGRREPAARRLRARAVRLAEDQTLVLLPLSLGLDLPGMRYRLRQRARGR